MRTLTAILFLTVVASAQPRDYKVLATKKTSSMEKEMNDAAANGFVFASTMGGETSVGGNEMVVVMKNGAGKGARKYRLLATSKTSTMEKELQQLGDEGYAYKGQTVYASTFGGREVVVILEHGAEGTGRRYEYRLQATSKTSTMEKELKQAGADGFELMATTVAKTSFAGAELVSILMRAGK